MEKNFVALLLNRCNSRRLSLLRTIFLILFRVTKVMDNSTQYFTSYLRDLSFSIFNSNLNLKEELLICISGRLTLDTSASA